MKRLLRNLKNRYVAPIVLRMLDQFGMHYSLKTPDRAFLENEIIGKLLAGGRYAHVLFAGVEMYTWHYRDLLASTDFHTIDRDANKRRYGNGPKHRVGSVCDLGTIYKPGQFNVVVFNGLVGYGLDSKADVDRALIAAYEVLADGGVLIIGWNNTPAHLDFALDELAGYQAYNHYVPRELALSSHRLEIQQSSRHTFDFLSKGDRAD